MKKTTFILLLCATFALFANKVNAQDGYTYTLMHNGGYSFTVQAVPNASSNNFGTIVQSYGFTLILPDGATITTNSSLGGTAGSNFFDAASVPGGEAGTDGYLVTENLASPATLSAPSAGTNTDVFTFTVNGNPTMGILKVAPNNSAIMTTNPSIGNSLKAFMQADMIDNGMTEFANVVDENGAAVSGDSSFNLATLSTDEVELVGVNVFPNPVKDVATITGVSDIEAVEVTNINGQRVLSKTSNLETIDMTSLPTGIYFAKIKATSGSKTVKLIKE